MESALLAGLVTLSGEGRVFHSLSGWAVVWYVLGILLLIVGALCAAWVVRPRLRAANLKAEAQDNFIYFGHLRHLTPEAVQARLEDTTLLPVLSKQLVEMSKIAWTKHRLVQLSMSLAPVGVVALGICATY
ncbi:hypothetical protein ACT18_21830 [Mycolicibacter kumamotonensis]|uniref:Pycsar effector protein domain-containing protein n=1 Tax=Mycolicibacter kumamotonensis TaxID=354243 RepID=A0A1B8SAA4_9MYCO|nr:hypothetical protein ACT18_21830 [Mycolicibacter kumamotonensis]